LARECGDILDRGAPPDEPIVCVAVAEEGVKLLLILEFHRPP